MKKSLIFFADVICFDKKRFDSWQRVNLYGENIFACRLHGVYFETVAFKSSCYYPLGTRRAVNVI